MVRVLSNGQMVVLTLVAIQKTQRMATERSAGPMDADMMVRGLTANSLERESIQFQTAKVNEVYGKMEREFSGYESIINN